MAHCSVPRCTNDSRKKGNIATKLSFHEFPRDTELRKRWIVAVKRDEGPDFKVTHRTYVCSEHFGDEDFKKTLTGRRMLKPGVVPARFSWSYSIGKRKAPTDRTPVKVKKPKPDESSAATTVEECGLEFFHDYHQPPTSCEVKLDAARGRIAELEEELKQAQVSRFGLDRFSGDDDQIRFYTGFPNYQILKCFYEALVPHFPNMITWTQVQRLRTNANKTQILHDSCNQKLSFIDQLFMFLHKVRVGSKDEDLRDKFGVSQPTVSRNTISWSNFLYCVLGSQPLWPTRAQVQAHMPPAFKSTYPMTRVILDATELKVQAPSSLTLNSEMFSSYKGTTTLKGLIGISPSGAVTFVSTLYFGSISDKHITKVSGVLDLLEEGDQVMVDKGFLIQEFLAERGCALVIPNFLASKGQFSSKETTENEDIARLRVHVERAIRRVRGYHIFDSVVHLNLGGTINQLWTVCCLLSNFQGPLIKLKTTTD